MEDDGEGIFGGDFGLDSDEETKVEDREKRTFQSEEDFQAQKRSWTPKIETKEVPLPPPLHSAPTLSPRFCCSLHFLFLRLMGANIQELLKALSMTEPKSKFDLVSLKSAGEYLYYTRDYERALEAGERVLRLAGTEEVALGAVEKAEVESLVARCRRRLSK
jgi:hypothetical protein